MTDNPKANTGHAHSPHALETLPANAERNRPWRPPLTKIMATVGPSITHPDVVEKMIDNGARIFRLNFSHGTFDEHLIRLKIIRETSKRMRRSVSVVGDLSGPKIRTLKTPDEGINVRTGQDVIIDSKVKQCTPGDVPVLGATYEQVASETKAGNRVLIADGAIRMLCIDADGSKITCRVINGGTITTGKGINLPDATLSIPALTPHDWNCIEWAVENSIDYLAMSFVRSGGEVKELADHLRSVCSFERNGTGLDASDRSSYIPIIAKIETPQAVEHIQDIIEIADGLMVARGDLGVEMDNATVPVIQKKLVRVAHDNGKPVIVATQMLESMITSPTPTRAEVSDVANAILDGADAVMLSAETAVGKYPHLAVDTMRRVALATEAKWREEGASPMPPKLGIQTQERIPALAHGAWHIARDIDAKLIVAWSQLGAGVRYLSRNNFQVPILGFSTDIHAVRRMNLLYGVYPILMREAPEHRSQFANVVDEIVLELGLVQPNEPMVLLGGKPLDAPGTLNTIAVRNAGELRVSTDER